MSLPVFAAHVTGNRSKTPLHRMRTRTFGVPPSAAGVIGQHQVVMVPPSAVIRARSTVSTATTVAMGAVALVAMVIPCVESARTDLWLWSVVVAVEDSRNVVDRACAEQLASELLAELFAIGGHNRMLK